MPTIGKQTQSAVLAQQQYSRVDERTWQALTSKLASRYGIELPAPAGEISYMGTKVVWNWNAEAQSLTIGIVESMLRPESALEIIHGFIVG